MGIGLVRPKGKRGMRVLGWAAALSLFVAVPAQAAERLFDVIAANGKTGVFVDLKSKEQTGSVVTFWNLMVGVPPALFGPQSKMRYIVSKVRMDCAAQTGQSIAMVAYDTNDQVVTSSTDPSTVSPINPGSTFSVEYKYICLGQRPNASFKMLPHIRDVLAYLDSYTPPSDAPSPKD